MPSDNHTHLAQADSFNEMYDYAVGMKSEFDTAFAKWAKKRNIKTGFPRKMNQSYKSEATLIREGKEAKEKAKADRKREAANKKGSRSVSFVGKLLKSIDKPEFKNSNARATVNLDLDSQRNEDAVVNSNEVFKAGKQRLRLSKMRTLLKIYEHGSHNYDELVTGIESLKERILND